MGGRRFVEGLYQALFSFRLARRNVIFKAKRKIEPDLRLILLGLVGKIVKYRPLSEPIRLQDLEDSARLQAWEKIKRVISEILFMVIYAPLSLVLSTLHKRSQELKQSQGSQLGVWERGYEGHKLAKLAGICCHRLPNRWFVDGVVLPVTAAINRNGEEKPAIHWSFEMGIGGESDRMLFDFIFRVT